VGAGDSLTAPERLDKELPPRPEVGFFGRDEALLALDRAFDSQKIVLLHAYAGSGKTSTAAEFARWYWRTGGIDGPVLFTSFEQYKPLGRVLDHFGDRFGPALAEVGVQWLALKDEARRNVALDVMRQIPVLWIWDNVETIAGFPAGTTSAWQPGEQVQLKEFLRAASETQAKFLLTSRREEHEWLGELPAHIAVSGMPLQERVQLARALAKRYGRQLSQLGNWRSLFEFTGGNPLTITVVVGQALRQGLQTTKQLEDFVAKLRAGSASLEDDESQGRERSLGASLSYGFKQNFSAQELKILALLHLFQGMVDARVLSVMANLNQKSGAPAIPVLSSQEVDAVLERAAEIGMLTPTGNRMFLIHPALPWYFRTLFESSYSDPLTVTRNYVEAIAELGSYFRYVYDEGQRNLLFGLRDEEQNLLHALALARANGWWEYVAPVLRVLRRFYEDSGRQLEYFRLLAEALPDFIGLKTDEPLPGREAFWKDITGLRANQASRVRDFGTSERLYKRLIAKARQEAAESLKKPVESWDESDKDAVGSLAYFLNNYGNMLWFAGRPDCVEPTEESVHLFELLNDPGGVASSAFDLGHAYMDFPQIYDLSKAEYWYGKRLEIERQRKDPQGIAMAMHELGQTAYRRFQEARQKRQGADEMLLHLNRAIEYASQALRTMPEQAIGRTNQIHHLLGNIYDDVGQLELALPHYQKTIEFSERQGDTLYAAKARREMARAYLKKGRLDEAFEYALAALRDVESFNGSAPEDLKRSQDLVREIQRIMSEKATV
jgi:tetratricopeptide (TPR) repeat protein